MDMDTAGDRRPTGDSFTCPRLYGTAGTRSSLARHRFDPTRTVSFVSFKVLRLQILLPVGISISRAPNSCAASFPHPTREHVRYKQGET
jgi:hypothetical protein